jgi:hypothetical protein
MIRKLADFDNIGKRAFSGKKYRDYRAFLKRKGFNTKYRAGLKACLLF